MAYTLGNTCAKNLCKRIVLLQIIIENVVTCFFGTQCTSCWRSSPLTSSDAVNYVSCDADMNATHLQRHVVMPRTAGQRQLSDDIEACLSGYEKLLFYFRIVSSTRYTIRRTSAATCYFSDFHDNFFKGSADQRHFYVIANHVGHPRTILEQTGAAVNLRTTMADDWQPLEMTSRYVTTGSWLSSIHLLSAVNHSMPIFGSCISYVTLTIVNCSWPK